MAGSIVSHSGPRVSAGEHAARRDAGTFSRAMIDARNYNRWILSTFEPFLGRSVMEVGIGHGGFADLIHERGLTYLGVDVDPALVEEASRARPEVAYVCADVTDPALPERVAGRGLDTVLCANVLEHIADDRGAVENMLSVVPPGGHVLLFVPAHPALYGGLDRLAGHLRRYDRGMLRRLAAVDHGRVRRLEFVNPLGGVAWWLNGWLPHRSLDGAAVNRQIELFDRYLLPVSRALTPLLRGVFGQSLVCVVERT